MKSRLQIRKELIRLLQLFADKDCQYDNRENRDALAFKARLYSPDRSLEGLKRPFKKM